MHMFSLFWCHSFPKCRCRNVCQSFCPKFSVGLHSSRLTTSCCSESCPGLHSKSITCVEFQTDRRPQTYNFIFSIVVLGLVKTCGFGFISAQEASFANSFSICRGPDPSRFLVICACSWSLQQFACAICKDISLLSLN